MAGYGTVIFVIIFFGLQASDQSTGFKYMLTAIVKSVPAQFLAWTVSRNQQNWTNTFRRELKLDDSYQLPYETVRYQNLINSGLLLCGVGDFLLHMDDHPDFGSELWFLAGLVAFLVGHIFFMFGVTGRSKSLAEYSGSKPLYLYPTVVLGAYALFMLKLLTPGIKDPALKVGVVVYIFVIARMTACSLVLSNQEANYHEKLLKDIQKLPRKDTPEATFLFIQAAALKRQFHFFHTYSLASLFFLISDSILGYGKFVDQNPRQGAVLFTYFIALILFAFSTMDNMVCMKKCEQEKVEET